MKKGFTLVEISIVLVIIGMISVMVIKGKQLLLNARYIKEWTKITNITTSLEHYIKSGKPIGETVLGDTFHIIDLNPFLDYTGLTRNDLKSDLQPLYYVPQIMSIRTTGDYYYKDETGKTPNVYGIYTAQTPDMKKNDEYEMASTDYICRLERMFDDKNLFAGKLRYFQAEPSTIKDLDYENCDQKLYKNTLEDFAIVFPKSN